MFISIFCLYEAILLHPSTVFIKYYLYDYLRDSILNNQLNVRFIDKEKKDYVKKIKEHF